MPPTYVLHLTIPTHWSRDVRTVPNNLPPTDFDDTRFIGRDHDRRDVLRHIRSPHPVVTIVGECGIGKTALALRCLYDVIEVVEPRHFDAVVWTTLKTRALTPTGIRDIDGAIRDVLSLFATVAKELGAPQSPTPTRDELLGDILTYLSEFRVLLAIDNLESIALDSLRPLLVQVPQGTKVLLTSRRGLGELEVRYPLEPLTDKDASVLFRRFARSLNMSTLAALPTTTIARYCDALHFNPLLIKWFVSSVSAGTEPSRLIRGSRPAYVDALRFCFENLFSHFNDIEQRILHILTIARRPLTRAELVHLLSIQELESVDWALSTLHNSSTIRRTLDNDAVRYTVTDIAAEYISKLQPPSTELYRHIQTRMRELKLLLESESVNTARYKYEVFAIHGLQASTRVAAPYLRRALDFVRDCNYDAAAKEVTYAKDLVPDFAECFRIGALIESSRGEAFRADQEYHEAIELAADSGIVRYSYASFLLHSTDDPAGALEQLEHALEHDSHDPTLRTARAMCLTRLGRYEDAATLYEQLLAELEGRPRKWRLSTKDQAAECYRRLMEQDARGRDVTAFNAHFQRGIGILTDAAKVNEFDEKSLSRFWRLVRDGLAFALRTGDASCAGHVADSLSFIGQQTGRNTAPPLVERDLIDFAFEFGRLSLLGWVSSDKRSTVGRDLAAVVSNANESGATFVAVDDAGHEWVLQASELMNAADRPLLSAGTTVRFVVVEHRGHRVATGIRVAGRVSPA